LTETSPSHWLAKEGAGVVGAMREIVLVVPVVGDVVRPIDVVERAAIDGEVELVRLMLSLTWAVPAVEPPCSCDHEGPAASARLRARPTVFIERSNFRMRSILGMDHLLLPPPEGDVAAEALTAKSLARHPPITFA
jgi:hypothetical protein